MADVIGQFFEDAQTNLWIWQKQAEYAFNDLIYGVRADNRTVELARSIGVNAALTTATKPVVDAYQATIKWGEDTQRNIMWLAGGAAGFLDTAGEFANALAGNRGLLGSIGTILPIAVVGLLVVMMVMRR